MNRILKTAAIAAIAGIAVIGSAGAAQAFAPTVEAGLVGQHIGTTVTNPDTGVTKTIQQVDMNVQLTDAPSHYHEFDLTYTPAVDGVITFEGVGKERTIYGEVITGSIDTTNHTVTWMSQYVGTDGKWWAGTRWGVTTLPYTVDASGDLDWNGVSTGEQAGYNVVGGFRNVPAAAPAPVAGNHGEYVSGAVKAGLKGKELAAIAKDVTLVGPYTTTSDL